NALGKECSQTVLQHVCRERKTLFQPAGQALTTAESLQGVEAVVASPIFDSRDNIVAALYGTRNRNAGSRGNKIGPPEDQGAPLGRVPSGRGLAASSRKRKRRAAGCNSNSSSPPTWPANWKAVPIFFKAASKRSP